MADLPAHMRPERSFQGLILALQRYWADYGCAILQPYDMEVGARTFHPATTLPAATPPPRGARSGRGRGARPMGSPRAGPRTAPTARTPTACSTTISSR